MSDPFQPMMEDSDERVRLALEDLRAGRFIILTDDEDRENEGDLVIAADKITPEAINFMATYARGLICLALTEERVRQLDLPPMVPENTSRYETAFTVSVEARTGVTTGISAADRARTVEVCIDPKTRPEDLARPGHIFPLKARKGGVLVRAGQTEGSVDLARLAGLTPAGVICEVMKDDGSMARLPDLLEFGAMHRIRICTVADVIRFRLQNEELVHPVSRTTLQTQRGPAQATLYRSDVSDALHLALRVGEADADAVVPVRVHIASVLEDVIGTRGGENTVSMSRVLDRLFELPEGGVLLYLYAAGSGPRDLLRHFEAYRIQSEQGGTVKEAMYQLGIRRDPRDFGIGAQILANLGLKRIKLISNSPMKLRGLEGYGLEVVDYLRIDPEQGEERTL